MGHDHHESHAKAKIKLLASPLISHKEVSHGGSSDQLEYHHDSASDPEAPRPHQINDGGMHLTPQFQRHEEATTIELFYDLFFVANLTTFTSIHEINENHALSSYAGFFCILWFTWCQVGLFDVRYVTDSVIERIAKACQFGVMVGFAVVGPNFDPSNQKQATFRALSIILALSRFVLCLQYLTVIWHVKTYKNSKTPLVIISISNFIAGIIYLGIAFVFKKDVHSNAYIAWYVIAVAETALNIAVSSKWKVVSFKGTHLVQRMSLLTLIILGEGIIVVCKAISKIVKNEFAWSSATIGTITAAVAIIYILYMLYFDWLSHQHFGSIRQQIWAFLHFPFHLALVLSMEGTAQFIIWRKIIEVLGIVGAAFDFAQEQWVASGSTEFSGFVDALNETAQAFFLAYPPTYTKTYFEVEDALTAVGASTDEAGLVEAMSSLSDTIQNSLFTTYGIVAAEDKKATESLGATEELNKQLDVFTLVFVYFFVTAGLTLLLMNLLNYLSISHKSSGKMTKLSIIRLVFNTLVGLALCLIPLSSFSDAGGDYAVSSWILPTLTIALLLVLVVAHVRKPGGGEKGGH